MKHETIGDRLRRLRLAAGLSQRELSGPGVTFAYISRIESGVRTPSMTVLRLLAPKLGVDVGYLETGHHEDNHTLAVWFTPQAIRDHFEDDQGVVAAWVAGATDEELLDVGYACIGSDTIWREFHDLLVSVVEETADPVAVAR